MKLIDKLESLDCRRDDKARRVLNTAPDTVANISAETLENGVTLEALEALNVPVYRYNGQVTIHGKLPDFNPEARPAGYKAIFRNGNGSIGVRYIAIDAEKKELIARAARVSASGWFPSINSQGFDLAKTFHVHDESTREQVKQTALAALRSIPVSRFFGGAYAGVLPYGAGYYVCAYIGAIAAADLWPLIGEMLGVTETELAEKEAAKAREEEERQAKYRAECDERAARRDEARKALLATLPAPLTVEPKQAGARFRLLSDFSDDMLTLELSEQRGRMYYTITARNGVNEFAPERKAYKGGWPKALAAGRLFPV